MSDQEHQETNGTSNGEVPEIELIIKVGTISKHVLLFTKNNILNWWKKRHFAFY